MKYNTFNSKFTSEKENSMSNNVNNIFNDLEKLLEFCVTFGYKYDESCLYNMKNYTYQQFNKWVNGKNPKNMWVEDAKKYEDQFSF